MLSTKAKILLLFGVASLLYSIPASPQKNAKGYDVSGFWKAQDYLKLNQDERISYAVGFVDGISMAPALGAPSEGKNVVGLKACIDDGMQTTQIAAIIEKEVREHPEEWHWNLETVALNSLLKACRVTK
jgi:hypothetical protein